MTSRLRLGAAIAAALLASCGGGSPSNDTSAAPSAAERSAAPAAVARLMKPAERVANGKLDRRLAGATGRVRVWVSLDEASVATFKAERLAAQGIEMQNRKLGAAALMRRDATPLAAETLAQRARVRAQQDSVAGGMRALGARELGRVQLAHNAVAVRVDASRLAQIAALPGVEQVRPVIDYRLDLSETVPYIGAAAVQASGIDGSGVRVAVLDSGIDYTHRNLGGPGTQAAYDAAYGTDGAKAATTDGLFPTGKVIDGYDFVGETWPDEGDEAPDPDPIDFQGHGTHVADIIAGRSKDGTHKGVAPGASLLAYKVCSAVASTCSGIALLQAMDYALDPDRDGDISDAVDVINMSLGTDYGMVEDDLSAAAAAAVKLGVMVVASAGNAGNLPFVVGSPSTAAAVLSVAQTQVPSAKGYPLTISAPPALAGIYPNTATVAWAPPGKGFNGTVAFVGQGCPADGTTPEDPYLASPAGKVALIDRGSCSVSLKVDRAAKAGAVGVIVALVAAGDPISFANGGGSSFVPTIVIEKALADRIRDQIAAPVVASLSEATSIALAGSVVGSSARGPGIPSVGIKPEIGAPGASVSALAGSGDGEEAFGGTSGAAPMVAGAAALLIQAHPALSPEQLKAQLMNSAEPKIYTNLATQPRVLAPVSRIGAGEVRANRAVALQSAARDRAAKSASLPFGFPSVTQPLTLTRKLLVENFSDVGKVYKIKPSYRTNAGGAVRVRAPGSVAVGPRGRTEIEVTLAIDAARLPDWTLDSGANGGNGPLLDKHEFDGYLTLTWGAEQMTVPWHVLPRKSSNLSALVPLARAGLPLELVNFGAGDGGYDVFSLTGTSKKQPASALPAPGDNFATIDLRAVGVRLIEDADPANDVVQFAINTYGRRKSGNYPANFEIDIDVDRDGNADYAILNAESGGFATSGEATVFVYDFAKDSATAVAYADVDFNSANMILSAPAALVGLTRDRAFDFDALVFDNYFTDSLTDAIGTMTYTLGKPRYEATGATVSASVAPFAARTLGTRKVAGGAAASPSQSGLLLMYRRDAGREADIVKLK